MTAILPVAMLLLVLPEPVADPFPILRVPLAEQARPPATQPWIVFSPAEFEARLRAAAATPPRLAIARYAAVLEGDDLTGSLDWTFQAHAPGAVLLDPLNLAISDAHFAKTPALLDRVGNSSRLWVEVPGEQVFSARWSARGRSDYGALRYELRLPAAPLATLEVDLPIGRALNAGEALVTGPFPSPKLQHSRYRLAFGGRSRLDLLVRSPEAAEPVKAHRSVRYDLAAASATFDFELAALRGNASAWRFRVDPGVQIIDVLTPQRDPWSFDAATRLLTIRLRDPLTTGRVQINAAVPITLSGTLAPLASIQALALPGTDTLEIRIAGDIRLDAWEPGDYSLLRGASIDRGYALQFAGSWRSGETRRRPVQIALRPAPIQLQTSARLHWLLDETRNTLEAHCRVEVRHGPVTQCMWTLPPTFSPGLVKLVPDDPGATTTWEGNRLRIEPSRPWQTGQSIEVLFTLQGQPPEFTDDQSTLPIPRLTSDDASDFQLAISLPENLSINAPGFERQPDGSWTSTQRHHGENSTLRLIRSAMKPLPAEAPKVTEGTDVSGSTMRQGRIDPSGFVHWRETARVKGDFDFVLPQGAILQSTRCGDRWIDPSRMTGSWKSPQGEELVIDARWAEPLGFWDRPQCEAEAWTSDGPWLFWPRLERTSQERKPLAVHSGVLCLAALVLAIILVFVRMHTHFHPLVWLLLAVMLLSGRLLPGVWGDYLTPMAALTVLLAVPFRRLIWPGFLGSAGVLAAQPVLAPTIYVSPSAVYVPPGLLERLKISAPPDVAWSSVDVVGGDDGAQAHFEMTFQLTVARAGEHAAVLPVQGLALESVQIDGRPAFPIADGTRLHLSLTQPGRYAVTVRGRAPIRMRGTDREVILAIDPLPSARLRFDGGAGARMLTVPGREGAARHTKSRIDVDLGAVSPIVIRWRAGEPSGSGRISAREVTLWDVSPRETTVSAAFHLRTGDRSLTQLDIELPADLEPGRATIRDARGNVLSVREIRLGSDAGPRRTATLILQEPLEDMATILLPLTPRQTLSATPALSAVHMIGADVEESSLLVRTSFVIEHWQRNGWAKTPPDGLLADFPELNAARGTVYAFRKEGGDGWLKPEFPREHLPRPFAEDLTWRFGAEATTESHLRFRLPVARAAVEFEVPQGVVLAKVLADDLADWSRQGNRVRVWFRAPKSDFSLRWLGAWPEYKPGVVLAVPSLSGGVTEQRVRIRAEEPFLAEVLATAGWRQALSFRHGETAWVPPVDSAPLQIRVLSRP